MGMAKRSYSKKGRNIEPAVETITFYLGDNSAGGAPATFSGSSTIDLSQCASIVNRRFYRQGLNWAVAGFTVLGGGGTQGFVSFAKMQNTWVTSGAWEKTFRSWKAQQDRALNDMGARDTKGAFNDYKVHLDTQHVTDGFGANLLPIAFGGSPFIPGEWQSSEVVIPNDGAPGVTNEYAVKMYGTSDASAKSILGGYSFSRARPQSPDPATPNVATSWLNELFDVGDNNDEVIGNAVNRNDELPYDQAAYPGSATNGDGLQYHDTAFLTGTTVSSKVLINGTNVPCGLLRIQQNITVPAGESAVLLVHLVPGNHRGYLCEPMTEM